MFKEMKPQEQLLLRIDTIVLNEMTQLYQIGAEAIINS